MGVRFLCRSWSPELHSSWGLISAFALIIWWRFGRVRCLSVSSMSGICTLLGPWTVGECVLWPASSSGGIFTLHLCTSVLFLAMYFSTVCFGLSHPMVVVTSMRWRDVGCTLWVRARPACVPETHPLNRSHELAQSRGSALNTGWNTARNSERRWW